MTTTELHQDKHVHRTVGAPVKFMLIRILDDLDIQDCAHCENLRFDLLRWFKSGTAEFFNFNIPLRTPKHDPEYRRV